jgi:hypothetical protein
MRTSKIPGLPDFPSQFVLWLILPGIVFWLIFYIPLLLSRLFPSLQGKGKYLQFGFLIWGASYFLPALIFIASSSFGTVCDLYNKNITPQLMYTDAFAVCAMMILHVVVEQADMKSAFHATGTLMVGTLIPYPLFLFQLTNLEHAGYKVSANQRWSRWLFLFLGVFTLLIWVVPLVSFWNTYHCLDLRHSGVGVAPDHASAWATGVVTVGWFMFSTWAIPQIRHWYWSYLFVVVGISHLAFAMGLFLFIRLSENGSKYFLKSTEFSTEKKQEPASIEPVVDNVQPKTARLSPRVKLTPRSPQRSQRESRTSSRRTRGE